MKILTIASILPVPGLIKENKYIIDQIRYHLYKYNEDEFLLLRPTGFLPKLLIFLSKNSEKWQNRKAVLKNGKYCVDNLEIIPIPYISIGSSAFFHSILSYSAILFNKKLLNNIKKLNIDIIHAHNLFPDLLLASYLSNRCKIPFISTLQEETRFFKYKLSTLIAKQLLMKARRITTPNYLMLTKLNYLGFNDVKLVPLGIRKEFFNLKAEQQFNGMIRLVSVANLTRIKNLHSVIKAIGMLKVYHNKITYTIIGDGPEKQNLIKLTYLLGLSDLIQFKSTIPNELLANELVKYNLFIQPSFKETFGITYFEALACGLPVILTKNTGAYYLIKDYNCYQIVDPKNVYDIAEKIELMLSKIVLKQMLNDCRKASKIADWDKVVNIFKGFYELR